MADKLSKIERQKRLISMLSTDSSMLIRDIANSLNVSRETIRRDFDELSKDGRLHRRYGGVAFAPIGLGTDFEDRSVMFIEERRAIARHAATMMTDNEVVMLGSGVTCRFFAAELLEQRKKVTVITNSISAALVLGKSDTVRVLIAPGEYDNSEGFLFGHETTDFIDKFHADVCVFSVDGISASGLMEIDSRTCWTLRSMIKSSRRKILVADHSKHHQKSLEKICDLDELDVFVTDQDPDDQLQLFLDTSGIEIHSLGFSTSTPDGGT